MTKAMPFLQKAILLSYDPRPLGKDLFFALWIKLPLKFLSKVSIQIFDLNTLLLHGITITNGNSTVFFRIEIISNTEWCSDFILTTITLTNVTSVIKFTVILLSQLCVNAFCTFI